VPKEMPKWTALERGPNASESKKEKREWTIEKTLMEIGDLMANERKDTSTREYFPSPPDLEGRVLSRMAAGIFGGGERKSRDVEGSAEGVSKRG